MKFKYKNDKEVEIFIDGSIGKSLFSIGEEKEKSNTYNTLSSELIKHPELTTIDIYINSTGGSVYDGIAMYNLLKRHKAYKRVFIEGFACSIASVIAMCGNSIHMPKSSVMMIHNAWTIGMGNHIELRKQADDLEKVNQLGIEAYMSKFKNSREELQKLLDEESYLTANDCLKYGLCTKVIDDLENTEEKINQGINDVTKIYKSKFEQLDFIKNAIRELEKPSENVEESNETKSSVEQSNEANSNEALNSIENAKNSVSKNIEEMKENVLARFFNVQKDEKENEK